MIEKILSGSPCLKSLELDRCYGYRQIDVTSKSVKKLVLFEYYCGVETKEDIIDCIKINAPYISSLTNKRYEEFVIFAEEIFGGLLESLGHVENITFGDHCSELLSRLKAGSDTSDDDGDDNGDREEQIASRVGFAKRGLIPLVACGLINVPFAVALPKFQLQCPKQEIEVHFSDPKQYEDYQVSHGKRSLRKSFRNLSSLLRLSVAYVSQATKYFQEREAQRQLTGSIDGFCSVGINCKPDQQYTY
nr:hypothetical protein [Tanacetum cinerariifolium]